MATLCLLILIRKYGEAQLVNPGQILWRSSGCQSLQDTMAKLSLSILAYAMAKPSLLALARYYGKTQLINHGQIIWQNPAYYSW